MILIFSSWGRSRSSFFAAASHAEGELIIHEGAGLCSVITFPAAPRSYSEHLNYEQSRDQQLLHRPATAVCRKASREDRLRPPGDLRATDLSYSYLLLVAPFPPPSRVRDEHKTPEIITQAPGGAKTSANIIYCMYYTAV